MLGGLVWIQVQGTGVVCFKIVTSDTLTNLFEEKMNDPRPPRQRISPTDMVRITARKLEDGDTSHRLLFGRVEFTGESLNVLYDVVLREDSNIKTLEFEDCLIEDGDLIQMLSRLKQYPQLAGIRFNHMLRTPIHAAALATAMQEVWFKKIDVEYSMYGDDGARNIIDALRDCGVEFLNLARTNLTAASANYLSQTLMNYPTALKTLDLSRNAILSEGACCLATALPHTKLECLLVNWNGIRDEGIAAICEAVIKTPSMRELSLSRNRITNMSSIVKMLEQSNLEHLHLNASGIDRTSLHQLAIGVKYSRTLHTLELKHCRQVDNPSVEQFLRIIGGHMTFKKLDLHESGVTEPYIIDVNEHINSLHGSRVHSLIALVAGKTIPRVGCRSLITRLPLEMFRLVAGMV
jgi:hypothetical protein